ncbi:hypothetical protein, partial [Rhodosalinus sp.]|uniref:hypothetical protein n=1 Tax=Rhodosalinus sp. TaxID=2047741 RepID=UPI00397B3CB1
MKDRSGTDMLDALRWCSAVKRFLPVPPRVSTCPMESLETRAHDGMQGLGAKGVWAVAAVTLGRHAEEDPEAAQPKGRLPASHL